MIKITSMTILLTFILLSNIANAACWSKSEDGDFNVSFTTKVRSYFLEENIENIDLDVEKRLSIGDFRFIAARGFVLYFPNLNGVEDEKYICKYGWRIMSGISDVYSDEEDAAKGIQLIKYAKRYNIALMKVIKVRQEK